MKTSGPKKDTAKMWDVIVIGGGPAGMMAAGRAAELGSKVLLLEKNEGVGKKLLITGGGRCNVTNNQLEVRTFLKKYKESDKFLFSAFSQHSVKDTLDFFHVKGMQTKVEAENRVFPTSDSARSVWNVLVEYMKAGKVEVQTEKAVSKFITAPGSAESGAQEIQGVRLKNGIEIRARKFILSTGGTSRPETGSTGEGLGWLETLGHTVVPSNPALVPVEIKDTWVKELSGVTLTNIKLTTFQNNQKQEVSKGKILFTHFGITGPTVLNMSKDIGELLKYGDVEIRLDILPHLDHGMLNTALQDLFKTDSNKMFKNSISKLIPSALVPQVLKLSGIKPETQNNSVTREERLKLIEVIKNIPMQVKGLLGTDKAVVSSGGVLLDEVDFKTMQSRKVPNLYLIGDILNIDRPSGGYSLQLCWTTGFVAGTDAAQIM